MFNFKSVVISSLFLGFLTTIAPTITIAQAESNPTNNSSNNRFGNLPVFNGKATVILKVKGKPIKIEIDGTNAPVTAGNFLDLVKRGFYNDLTFHRVEKNPQPFVVQGGDPRGNGTGGFVDPQTNSERRIPLEIKAVGATEPTYGQTIDQLPILNHKRGAIAMARTPIPDSASSQFYIDLSGANFLDGKYAVFGYVTEGMDIVDQIAIGDKIDSIEIITDSTIQPPPSVTNPTVKTPPKTIGRPNKKRIKTYKYRNKSRKFIRGRG